MSSASCVCVCHSAHLNSLRNKSCDKIQMPNITRHSKQIFLLCKMRSSTLWLFIYFYAFVFICNSICIDLFTLLSLLSHFLLQTIEINIQAICYKQCYIHSFFKGVFWVKYKFISYVCNMLLSQTIILTHPFVVVVNQTKIHWQKFTMNKLLCR